jgi:F0F1-type ATP synthase membrane subunit b/b'
MTTIIRATPDTQPSQFILEEENRNIFERLNQIETENCELLAKYNERLDKLIEAETTIKEMSEQIARAEKQKFETQKRHESRPSMIIELPPLDEDG